MGGATKVAGDDRAWNVGGGNLAVVATTTAFAYEAGLSHA